MDDDTLGVLKLVKNSQNVLLHGEGGTGKSYLLRMIASAMKKCGKTVYCTATTGIAAINLSSSSDVRFSGMTLHKWSGVGLAQDVPQKLLSKVLVDPSASERWRETDILIIDEVSMLGCEFIEKLNVIGQAIRRNYNPFGGIQLLLSGDFLQLPPVKDGWIFEGETWSTLNLVPYILQEPKRYDDVTHFQLLGRVRKALHTPEDMAFLESRVEAYREWKRNEASGHGERVKPTILHSKKVDVSAHNMGELEKLQGTSMQYLARDDFLPYNTHARSDHYIKLLDEIIPKCIPLRIGAQVMLKANLDITRGLANGSRGVVTSVHQDGVGIEWKSGIRTVVTTHTWSLEDKDAIASRTQIPLILAWATTIHSSQGLTLDYAICDIGPSIFSPGQAYVALSRVRSSRGLLISNFYPKVIKADTKAIEYVDRIEKEFFQTHPRIEIEIQYELNFVDKKV